MSIVVDRPATEPAIDDPPPPTAPRRRRHWWRWRFPWVKTAVSAPLDDQPLLIRNRTDEAWALSLNYHDLGVLPPHDQYSFSVVKRGLLCARQPQAPIGTAYLTLALKSSISTVEIDCDLLQGQMLYDLRPLTRS